MAKRYGKCSNVINCSKADSKEVIEVLDGIEFTCPECYNELNETTLHKSSSSFDLKKIIKVGALVLIAGLAWVIISMFIGGNNEACKNLPFIAAVDTTLVCNDIPYNMHPGDTLLILNDKVSLKRKSSVNSDSTVSTPNAQDEYYDIKRRSKIRIGSQSSAPPLNYIDDAGKRRGLDYEIAQLLFKQSEFGFTNSNSISADHWVDEYDQIPSMLVKSSNGGFDLDIIMGGLTFQDGDDPNVIYTLPYLDEFGYSLISKTGDGINTLRDLRNSRIGIVNGDVDVKQYVQSILPPGAKIVELSDEEDTWIRDNITDGKADAVIYDYPFAASELKNMGGRGGLKIKIAKLPSSDISYRIGLRKGNEILRKEINSAIRKVKSMPQYGNLLRKYLKTDNVVIPRNANNNPTHTVLREETLSIIAQNHLGNLDRWTEIQELNNIPNPHLISVGQTLIMPSDYRQL